MLAAAQLEILDEHCGPEQRELRAHVAAAAHARLRAAERGPRSWPRSPGPGNASSTCSRSSSTRSRPSHPSEEEQNELVAERDRLRHVETLRGAAAAAAEAIVPEDGEGGGAVALSAAAQPLEQAGGIDPALVALSERLQALRFEAEDLGGELRGYVDGIEGSPGRLEEVEERLGLFARLERKHGGSIAEVLAHAERCRARRDQLERAEVELGNVEAELAAARQELTAVAEQLGARRRQAAPALAEAVRVRLAELAMADASFEVVVRAREDGIGPRGGGRRRVPDRAEPGPAGRAAARDRLRRRALAGDAGAAERGAQP